MIQKILFFSTFLISPKHQLTTLVEAVKYKEHHWSVFSTIKMLRSRCNRVKAISNFSSIQHIMSVNIAYTDKQRRLTDDNDEYSSSSSDRRNKLGQQINFRNSTQSPDPAHSLASIHNSPTSSNHAIVRTISRQDLRKEYWNALSFDDSSSSSDDSSTTRKIRQRRRNTLRKQKKKCERSKSNSARLDVALYSHLRLCKNQCSFHEGRDIYEQDLTCDASVSSLSFRSSDGDDGC